VKGREGKNTFHTNGFRDAVQLGPSRASAPAREAQNETDPLRVLVCGSRDWEDHEAITRRLSALPGEHRPVTIVQGGARGADRMAARAARYWGFDVEEHPADWEKHGKIAGPIRNREMLDSGIDLVLAFQRDGSRGTQHTIDEARRRGIPVEVVHA
jgi:hypothetical protein